LKLIIQIPCHNEAETLPATIADLPKTIPGIDCIEYLVVDDGSTDSTSSVARELAVEHIIRLPTRQGLAQAFSTGLAACLKQGADIIVNTDGDNQYYGQDIERLIEPILAGRAEIVIGARPIDEIPHFSYTKKLLQRLGSWVVRKVSDTSVADVTSGFRAYSRQAALRLNVFSSYTYTLETIIQAGRSNMTVESIPVRVNPPLRESRLIRSIPGYIHRSLMTILRIFVLYKPLRFFVYLGSSLFGGGFIIGLRFLYFYFEGQGEGKIQSLILGAVLLLMGVQLILMGMVADLIATNRRILEDIQYFERARELKEGRQEAARAGRESGLRDLQTPKMKERSG